MEKDVVIIGAGPAGLFAGFYCGMRKLSAVIVDPLEVAGGRLAALYPEKYIYDVAGHDKIRAIDLIHNLETQLKRFEETTELALGEEVLGLDKEDEIFTVTTSKQTIKAKAVIIAAGSGAFAPRKLGLEGEETASNLHYFVDDLNKFKDRKVAIFGGGDSAVDWAMMLEPIAKEVNVIHRRDEFRAHGASVDKLMESTVNVHTPYTPKELVLNGDKIEKILIESKKVDDKELEVDDVIVNFGFVAKLGAIADFGLEIEKNKINVNTDQSTAIEGVYAIGDIAAYPGKAELIITGFGEGPIAVNSIYGYINPDAKVGALHSSSVIKG
ncbi:NAD(P)/FAD-dependent oxidoreductase [Mollicutes bacterium LVI A0078]|nr:NAD(P)/FAD-dependent oxidoreductase [Mollicutes bacterium LVI A0075]WOO90924.1 NAD(P)/FAD-dependent oxidoreductase [Mollicutes bacterium LVI A0078]